MGNYDVEQFENDAIQVIKDNLATKLTEINNQKNDGIICDDIQEAAYLSTLTDEYLNFTPFIFYQVVEIEPISNSFATAQKIKMNISVLIQDDNNSLDIRKKTFRYSRALKEIIEKRFKINAFCSKLEINEIPPLDLVLNENSPTFKIGGIILSTILT